MKPIDWLDGIDWVCRRPPHFYKHAKKCRQYVKPAATPAVSVVAAKEDSVAKVTRSSAKKGKGASKKAPSSVQGFPDSAAASGVDDIGEKSSSLSGGESEDDESVGFHMSQHIAHST